MGSLSSSLAINVVIKLWMIWVGDWQCSLVPSEEAADKQVYFAVYNGCIGAYLAFQCFYHMRIYHYSDSFCDTEVQREDEFLNI